MDSTEIDNELIIETGKHKPIKEVMDNSFISDEEEENCFTEEAFNGFIESMCECGLPNPISPSALKWLTEQDWFKSSDE